jgi:hypothetical protein
MLFGSGIDRVGMSGVGDNGIAGNAKLAGRRQQTHAFIAERATCKTAVVR